MRNITPFTILFTTIVFIPPQAGAASCESLTSLALPDGTIKYVRIVALAVKNRAGGVEFVGAVTDITDRKRAEQALRRREAYLVVGHS